ncbi:hypothetical protein SmJEL517_g04988 [Synchytrium microbalum]|uniref:MAGE domain-containing protein n=1 Tax=Synchytrium microbalum TaxID=1806994 RepID=A0A507C2M2_9FUNG|nr:uncharacterized protein SmJEL517_g04988 [Synchytrium microbalum]TPX31785.1 hypothetical protein SmJEL517_g04988 [Synchytrium microbalum]
MGKKRRNDDDDEEEQDDDEYDKRSRKSGGPSSSKSAQKKTKRPVSEDEDDEEADGGGRGSKVEGLIRSIPDHEMDALISGAVRVALSAEHARRAFTKKEISEKVLKERAKAVNHVFEAMQKRLKDVFGYDVKELVHVERQKSFDEQRRALAKAMNKKQANKNKTGQFVLVNMMTPHLQNPLAEGLIEEGYDVKQDGLLTVILSLIMVSGRAIDEKTLESYLRKYFHVSLKSKDSELGLVSDVLVNYTKQRYLIRISMPSAEGDVVEYKWGPRAIAEIPEKNMIKFIGDIHDDVDDATRRHLESTIRTAAEIEVPE